MIGVFASVPEVAVLIVSDLELLLGSKDLTTNKDYIDKDRMRIEMVSKGYRPRFHLPSRSRDVFGH